MYAAMTKELALQCYFSSTQSLIMVQVGLWTLLLKFPGSKQIPNFFSFQGTIDHAQRVATRPFLYSHMAWERDYYFSCASERAISYIYCKSKIVVLDNYYSCVTVLPTLIQRM